MATSQAQKMAVAKFRAEKCDRIAADVPKGKREVYHMAAKELQISLAALIQNGVEEYIRNHAGEVPAVKLESEKLSAADRRLVESAAKLPESTRKIIGKLIDDLAAQVTKGGGEND